MPSIIFDEDGNIDWNANGWPEPNAGADGEVDGYSIEGMPDDIFDMWLEMCTSSEDWGVEG